MHTNGQKSIRVLIVGDQIIVRDGLRLLLGSQSGLSVAGEAVSCDAAMQVAQKEQPDVVLLDLDLSDAAGMQCLPRLLEVSRARVLVLTSVYDLNAYYAVVRCGAMGILRKQEASDVLVKAIRKIAAGDAWLDGATTARVLGDLRRMCAEQSPVDAPVVAANTHPATVYTIEQPTPDEAARIAQLTEREREVIGLIGEGLRNQQVADRLGISVITVRHHLSSVFAKLCVGDRFELAVYSYRNGLAKLPL